jgi:acyl-CoA synthetase (AMP-forming)/AMP-acid ligase II
VSDAQRAELDLSALETLACAGEPVMADTLARFSELFAACGLRKRAIQPAYGLAEATLQAAIAPLAQGYVTVHADRAALERGELVTLRNERTDTITLTSSGRPVQHVEIVDPNTRRRCPAGIVGEIWVRSRAVTAGYWNRPGDSADVFGARVDDRETGHTYLRTGDMGVLHDGELFVTGRSKDLVIVRGENHWPQDIEATVLTAHAAVRPGGVAAFALTTTEGEALGVVAEIDERRAKSLENVIDAISVAIKRDHRLKPGVIALVPARAIPQTTSGKLRRRACRSAFLDGTLECLATAGARAH